ncbi:serine hydrolase domain-containing protein [Pediococcus argentinicus]|uniref:Beta-lactamase n=1 Tax=Pediococcus argentinicus TaxID=480391 RepID=A0A0R2NK58_9LACO|nr:serine hydrolase domain-containing protein [Pediococcus argentinicus]KRO26174.1 beta-lactamase [Pediococcus argentinicus]NKZ21621.1 serine hydrolase [Pediococcus argentinicus]GEP18794.1 hypothetical protein LSA03_01780 [Pediococcus argentinicus]
MNKKQFLGITATLLTGLVFSSTHVLADATDTAKDVVQTNKTNSTVSTSGEQEVTTPAKTETNLNQRVMNVKVQPHVSTAPISNTGNQTASHNWQSSGKLKSMNQVRVVQQQNRAKSSNKKVWDLEGNPIGSQKPLYFKSKYLANQFTDLSVKQQLKVGKENYYYFKNNDGKSAWIWQGYTGLPTKYTTVKKNTYKVKIKKGNSHPFFDHANYGDYRATAIHYQKNYVNKLMTVDMTARVAGKKADYLRVKWNGKNMGWIWATATIKQPIIANANLAVKSDPKKDNVQRLMNQYHLNGRVLVVKNGKVHSFANGDADHKGKVSNSSGSAVYAGASLQKAMTAAMIVQLITQSQKTKNSFTQYTTINRWLPSLRGGNTITLGSLMTQTSGIADPDDEREPGTKLSEATAVNRAIQRVNARGLRSKTFYYSNSNYILLAGIIRKITGKSYATNLKERIIKPLGLKSTYMWDQIPKNRVAAKNYYYSNGNYKSCKTVSPSLMSLIVGAGNMYTTPEDYYKFEKGLSNGKILNKSDYNYLIHLKTVSYKGYSGGMYVSDYFKTKNVYGSLAYNHVNNWVNFSLDTVME